MRGDPQAVNGVPAFSDRFENTHWTLIFQAARDPADTCARQALEQLCAIYWKPLYCFLRGKGQTHQDAEDLTQSFMLDFLARRGLASVQPARIPFRYFLLGCLKNFTVNEWRKAKAAKRNPGTPILSIDAGSAETRFQLAGADKATPDKVYDRACAWELVEQALSRLRARYEFRGKLSVFDKLSPCLMGRPTEGYSVLAEQLQTTEEALRMEVSRMRKDARRLLKEIIAPTAGSPQEVESEFQALIEVLAQ